MLALLFLLVRPAGLFGERAGRAGLMAIAVGVEHLRGAPARRRGRRRRPPLGRARRWRLIAFGVVPAIGNDYWFSAILIPFLVLSLAGLGLNLLTGYAGQLSLGSAAFMAVGAFAAYNFLLRVPGTARCSSASRSAG